MAWKCSLKTPACKALARTLAETCLQVFKVSGAFLRFRFWTQELTKIIPVNPLSCINAILQHISKCLLISNATVQNCTNTKYIVCDILYYMPSLGLSPWDLRMPFSRHWDSRSAPPSRPPGRNRSINGGGIPERTPQLRDITQRKEKIYTIILIIHTFMK